MSTRIQVRRDLVANWVSVNPVLYNGEIGFATDLGKFKIGDGSTTWNSLAYAAILPSEITELAQDALSTSLTGGSGISVSYNDAANTLTVGNTGTLSFNTRTGAVTLTSDDVTTALTYTPVSPTLLNTTIDNLENYADTVGTNEAIIRLAADEQEVIDRNAAIGTAKSEAISSSNSTTTSKVGDNTVTGVDGNTITARIATAKSEAISSSNDYTDEAITSLGNTSDETYVPLSDVANADGVASLDSTGNVPISQLGNLIAGAPDLLNTLDEIAAAINDDATISQTLTTAIGTKQDKVSGVSDTEIGYLDGVTSDIQTQINSKFASADASTTNITEGTNLYFTDERAQDAVGNVVGTGLTYTDSTGAISVTANTFDAFGAAASAQTAAESSASGYVSTHAGLTETHGATGAVVGTTNAQTLTNKTLTSPKINEEVALTATATELNVLDGITSTTAELNILDGVTATAAELNILDGVTASTTELNYVDGVTSGIQTQMNDKAPLDSPTFTTKVNVNTNNLNVGSGSEGLRTSDELTNPIAVFSMDADTDYAQLAVKNTGSGANSSTDVIAYAPNGDDTSGWIDMGITSPTFNDPEFTITSGNDGYIFMEAPAGTSGNGNLVIATGANGTDNKIVFAAGGLQSNNTQMVITPDDTVHVAISTESTSSSTGALTVDGGVGVVGALSVDGVARLTDTIYVGSGAESFDSASELTNPGAVISLSGGPYAQLAVHNSTPESSADVIAYASNGVDASGWIDMGITGDNFSQEEFGITGPNDGYIFMEAPAVFTETVTNKALTDNVATLTVGAHEFRVGMPVVVRNVDSTFNGDYTITAVSETTFSYAKTNANVASAEATGTATAGKTGAGNLVIATGANGSDNKIIFAAGGFASGLTQMEITPDVNVHIEIDTPSVSPTTGALTVVGGVGIQGDLNIEGDVSIEGTIVFGGAGTTVETNNLSVTDPLVYVGAENESDTVDLGLVGEYTAAGTTKYAGVVRDASDGVIKFFKDTATKPTTSVDFTTTALADIKVAGLDATSITIGGVSNTEIGYLDGVTSAIQTQINDKAPLAGPTFTGTVVLPSTTSIGDITSTELGYIDGVTSAIQTQIDAKAPSANPAFTGTVNLPSTTSIGDVSATELGYIDGVTSAIQTQLNNKQAVVANVSDTEIGYLDGVTSSIQTQLDAKSTDSKTETLTNKTLTSPVINTPTGITKSDVGLGNVDNTADSNKPVSTATQTALDLKLALAGGTMTGAITLHADPSSSLHAATKQYVDNTASGVIAKPQVLGATNSNIDATYNNGTAGVGATLTHNTNGVFPADAGGASGWAVGKGILVRSQTNKAHNGRYFISDMGSVSTPYVLTRCSYCDEASEIPGAYIFVQDGTFAGTGWIQVVADPATFVVGTDNIDVFQFSGSGTITAGTGITVSGNEVSISTGAITSSLILDGTIVNGDINASAAIDKTKISGTAITAGDTGTVTSTMILDGTILDADINASAAIAQSKVSGLTTDLAAKAPLDSPTFTGTVTLPTGTVTSGMILDGTIVAGDLADGAITSAKILDGTIVNADINASAAIDQSKIANLTTDLGAKIAKTDISAKGAILVGTGSGTYTAQTVGTNGQVLTANSAEADGVEWTTIPVTSAATPIALGTVYGGTSTVNTSLGYESLDAITTGENNIAIGNSVMGATTEGSYNVGIGSTALFSNTTGLLNTAVGNTALYGNTSGSINVALGHAALQSSTTGGQNTAVGASALEYGSTGNNNTALGAFAIAYNSSGSNNTAIGHGAGGDGASSLESGSNNIIIGYNAATSSTSVSNEITIGNSNITKFRIPGIGIDFTRNGPSDGTTSTASTGFGYMGIPQSPAATTGSYTVVAADAGEHIYTTATRTITIPANASVALPIGTTLTFIAAAGATATIAITSDTLLLAGPGTSGSRTLAPHGMATAVKVAATTWYISGNGLT
jgi:hypothetical protein